jgi:hypothetical protein
MTAFRWSTLFALSLLVAGCGGDEAPAPPSAEETPVGLLGALDAARGAAGAASQRSAPARSADDLRSRMPETVAGLPRVDLSVATGGMEGFSMTTVQARYEGDDRRQVEISMVDMGHVPGMLEASTPWLNFQFDRSTSTGFERTIRFEGFPGFESEERGDGRVRSELTLIVDGLMVQVEGRNVELETLHGVARGLNLGGLRR